MTTDKVVYGWYHNSYIFYVGIGSLARSRQKYKRSPYCLRKREKAEREGTFEIRILHNNLSWREACQIEIQLIEQFGRIDLGTGCLTNLTIGGEGNCGLIHTESSREKIREYREGKTHSDSTKEKMSKSKLGANNPRSKGISTPVGVFGSISEAVPVLKVSNTTIWKRVNSPLQRYKEYYYTE